MELIEGTLVLCTVKKIDKTTIFLDIENNGEGSMVLSEVVAGRIRNLRDYVTINKKLVCKILKIENSHVQLSLRRVTAKERDAVMHRYKKERNMINMLKAIIKNPEPIIDKIKKEYNLVEFFEEIKENPNLLSKFFTKQEAEKLAEMLSEKINKEKIVKKTFKLSSFSPSGLSEIKQILSNTNANIRYLGSSQFTISVNAPDFKEANKKLSSAIEQIQAKAKQKKALFELKEK